MFSTPNKKNIFVSCSFCPSEKKRQRTIIQCILVIQKEQKDYENLEGNRTGFYFRWDIVRFWCEDHLMSIRRLLEATLKLFKVMSDISSDGSIAHHFRFKFIQMLHLMFKFFIWSAFRSEQWFACELISNLVIWFYLINSIRFSRHIHYPYYTYNYTISDDFTGDVNFTLWSHNKTLVRWLNKNYYLCGRWHKRNQCCRIKKWSFRPWFSSTSFDNKYPSLTNFLTCSDQQFVFTATS